MKPFEEVYTLTTHIPSLCYKEELEKLYDFGCQIPETGLIVEIGSYMGSSAIMFAETGRRVVCIDPFLGGFDGVSTTRDEMINSFKSNVLEKYSNVSLIRKSSQAAIRLIDRKIDLLFVDGDHSYMGVKKDCELYLPKIGLWGFAAFHDYFNEGFSGIKMAVDAHTQGWHTALIEHSMIVKQRRPV